MSIAYVPPISLTVPSHLPLPPPGAEAAAGPPAAHLGPALQARAEDHEVSAAAEGGCSVAVQRKCIWLKRNAPPPPPCFLWTPQRVHRLSSGTENNEAHALISNPVRLPHHATTVWNQPMMCRIVGWSRLLSLCSKYKSWPIDFGICLNPWFRFANFHKSTRNIAVVSW